MRAVNNCEDIMMNFLSNKYYPYFFSSITARAGGSFGMRKAPLAVSKTGSHMKKRHNCIKLFSEKLGMIPLNFVNMNYKKVMPKLWKIPKSIMETIISLAEKPVSEETKRRKQ